jgi:uncharacterized membrane protein
MEKMIKKIICRDLTIALILILVLTIGFFSVFASSQKKHHEFILKINAIEKDVIELRAIFPKATSSRWTKDMMQTYNTKLLQHLENPELYGKPSIDEISITTPIVTTINNPNPSNLSN